MVRFGVHADLQSTTTEELRALWGRIEAGGFDWRLGVGTSECRNRNPDWWPASVALLLGWVRATGPDHRGQ